MADTKTLTLPLLFTDIETIPSQDPAIIAEIEARFPLPILDLDGIRADGRLKDEAKIADDIAAKREKAIADHAVAIEKRLAAIDEAYRKTALDGGKGHIASVAWAFDEDVVVALDNKACDPKWRHFAEDYEFSREDVLENIQIGERGLLQAFFTELEGVLDAFQASAAEKIWDASNPVRLDDGRWKLDITPEFVGWRGSWTSDRAVREIPVLVAHYADFDVRFIWQRAIALGVPVPAWWPVNASKYASDRVQDTMTMWAGHGNRISLDALCRALGVPGKTDLDGSGVWDAVKAGRLEDVIEYNRCDVRSLRSVHRRMRGLPVLHDDVLLQFKSETNYLGHVDLRRPGPITNAEIDARFEAGRKQVEELHGGPLPPATEFKFDEKTGEISVTMSETAIEYSDDTPGWMLSQDDFPFEWTVTKPVEIDENVAIQECTYGEWLVAEQKAWDAAKARGTAVYYSDDTPGWAYTFGDENSGGATREWSNTNPGDDVRDVYQCTWGEFALEMHDHWQHLDESAAEEGVL